MKNMQWNRVFRSFTFYLLLLFLILSLVNLFSQQSQQAREIDFSTFLNEVSAGNVKRVEITDQRVLGEFNNGSTFRTTLPPDSGWVIDRLYEQNVQVSIKEPPQTPWWTTMLTTMLPVILVIAAFFFIMQQTQGGGNRVMQFGRSRARLHSPDDKKRVTFDDVAG